MKETSFQEACRQEVTRILEGRNKLPDEWDKTSDIWETKRRQGDMVVE